MSRTIKDFEAILHTEWQKHPNITTYIKGVWAEDMSKYNIEVPEQLRDMIISLQNILCFKLSELKDIEDTLKDKADALNSIFN